MSIGAVVNHIDEVGISTATKINLKTLRRNQIYPLRRQNQEESREKGRKVQEKAQRLSISRREVSAKWSPIQKSSKSTKKNQNSHFFFSSTPTAQQNCTHKHLFPANKKYKNLKHKILAHTNAERKLTHLESEAV